MPNTAFLVHTSSATAEIYMLGELVLATAFAKVERSKKIKK
jgi:hypothetical protein